VGIELFHAPAPEGPGYTAVKSFGKGRIAARQGGKQPFFNNMGGKRRIGKYFFQILLSVSHPGLPAVPLSYPQGQTNVKSAIKEQIGFSYRQNDFSILYFIEADIEKEVNHV
jgi:hypothetical protein